MYHESLLSFLVSLRCIVDYRIGEIAYYSIIVPLE